METDKLEALLKAATPGPWAWFGQARHNQVYLATVYGGRQYVMDFVRWGMQSAQPRFQTQRGVMVDARDLLKFEVGEKHVTGIDAAKANGSVYRYDIAGIAAPDAALIAAAPDLAAEVLLARRKIEQLVAREQDVSLLASDRNRLRAENAQLVAANQALVTREAEARDVLENALDAWDTHNKTGDHMQGHWADDARAFLAGKAGA